MRYAGQSCFFRFFKIAKQLPARSLEAIWVCLRGQFRYLGRSKGCPSKGESALWRKSNTVNERREYSLSNSAHRIGPRHDARLASPFETRHPVLTG